ncbi:LCP family protein [Sporosarcina sp. BP05]|uniref:LCP family protein n=1 Tax=Sporosarcina sp. BP05 TaxID=2758726 RepID=UPI00351C8D13
MNIFMKSGRRKKLGILFVVMACIIGAGTLYWQLQYKSGLSLASESLDLIVDPPTFEKFEKFEAAKPQAGVMNVLLLGSDAHKDENGRSDTLMIAHYNQTTNDMKLVSIMRDTYVEIPDNGKQKKNAAFAFGGPELVRKTIKQNFDIDVQYYATVNFTGFSKIMDVIAPDGIEVEVPYPIPYGAGKIEPGKQVLNGDQLLGYVRFRSDDQNDFGRVERQQEVLSKVKDQAISIHTLLNVPKLLGLTEPYIDTNINKQTLLKVGKGLLPGKSDMQTLRIPIANSYKDERVAVGAVLSIDLEKNKQALQQFLSPEDEIGSVKVVGNGN